MNPLVHLFGRKWKTDLHATSDDIAPALLETNRERVMTDEALRSVQGSVQMPDDLSLRLRLAISHERVRSERRWSGRIRHRVHLFRENTLRRLAVPMAACAAASLVVIAMGVTLGAVTPAKAAEADDIPLSGFSAPRYLYTAGGAVRSVAPQDGAPLIVEASVNSTGQVYHYQVLSGDLTPALDASLRERMLSSVFRPASFFGEPVRGTVVLTFADVEVHG